MPDLQRERQFIRLRSERFDYISNFNSEYNKIKSRVESFAVNKRNEIRHTINRINSNRQMQINRERKTTNSDDNIELINSRADTRINDVESKLANQIRQKYGNHYERDICYKDSDKYKNMSDYDYNVLLGLYDYDYISSEFKRLYYLFDATFCQGNIYTKIIDEDMNDLQFISELLKVNDGYPYPTSHYLTIRSQIIQLRFNNDYISEYNINKIDLKEKYNQYNANNKKIIDNLAKDSSKINSYEYKNLISNFLSSLKELLIVLEPNTLLSIIDCDPEQDDFSSISNKGEDLDNSLFDVIANGNNSSEFDELDNDILDQLK